MDTVSFSTSLQNSTLGLSMISTPEIWILVGITFSLIIVSVLIGSAGVAYSSLSDSEKLKLQQKNKFNRWANENLSEIDKLTISIKIISILLNVCIVISVSALVIFLGESLKAAVLILAVQIFASLGVLAVFSFFIPKLLGTVYAFHFVRFTSFPLHLVMKFFKPLTTLMLTFESKLKSEQSEVRSNLSVLEISQTLDLSSDEELSGEKEILEGIIRFGNKDVAEIMKSRGDVIAIDIEAGFDDLLKLIIDSGFSRIPVYEKSFDNMRGILYVKDILPHTCRENSFQWQTLIRAPFFVPETKKISDLLEEFQQNKVHLAIVIDEYGGTAGVVSLEDVLEEIVGEIVDELDEDESLFTKISDDTYIFDGKVLLGDFIKITHCDEEVFDKVKGDAETLAGLILELKNAFPVLHEKMEFQQFRFTIEALDDRRIKKIKVEIREEED